jgi:hypothetical protein
MNQPEDTRPGVDTPMPAEQVALITAIADADAEPTARNRELARAARQRYSIVAVERVEFEMGIRRHLTYE